MKIILNTNVLLVSVSKKSKHHWLYRALLDGKFDLAITNEILSEYDEKISEHWHPDVAKMVLRTPMKFEKCTPNNYLLQVKINRQRPR